MSPRYRLSRRPNQRVRVLGVEMDLVKPEEVFHFAKAKVVAAERAIVANHNLHSLYLLKRHPAMQAFFRKADLIEFDSLPLILWARLIGRPSRPFHRCTYLDWRDQFWRTAVQNNWRVFFVGGAEGVAEAARAKILEAWPGVRLEVHHGYFDAAPNSRDNRKLIDQIHAFKANVILVGMGMPLQESWVNDNYDALPASVVFTVGGAFDYEAGTQVPCPRWIGRLGMEWMFRLLANPRRLLVRYCIEPWSLVAPAMHDLHSAVAGRLGVRQADRHGRTTDQRRDDAAIAAGELTGLSQ